MLYTMQYVQRNLPMMKTVHQILYSVLLKVTLYKMKTDFGYIEPIRKGWNRALECFASFTSYLDDVLDVVLFDYYPEDYLVFFLYLIVFLVPFSFGSKVYGVLLGPPLGHSDKPWATMLQMKERKPHYVLIWPAANQDWV